MSNKIEHVFAWKSFKELLKRLCPMEIYYAQEKAPLAKPPVGLRFIFTAEGVQYIFIDTAEGGPSDGQKFQSGRINMGMLISRKMKLKVLSIPNWEEIILK